MPIHNLGYREWEGVRETGSSRWTVVAGVGIRRAWQSAWLRRIAFVVWGPPLAYGVLIFLFEQVLTNNIQGSGDGMRGLLSLLLPAEMLPVVQVTLDGLDGADRTPDAGRSPSPALEVGHAATSEISDDLHGYRLSVCLRRL